jgi:hypothetical protein
VPVLDEEIRRGDDPTVGRADHGGVIAGADQCRLGRGQRRGDSGNEAELADVGNGDLASSLVTDILRRSVYYRLRYVLPVGAMTMRKDAPDND